jgi:hypothetical protein
MNKYMYEQGVRNVYVVCQPTEQMRSIVLQANTLFVNQGGGARGTGQQQVPQKVTAVRCY